MASHKIRYELEFIPYKEAATRFKDADGLFNMLKDGNALAYGDHCPDPLKEPTYGRLPIPPWCWQRYKFNGDVLFGGVDEHGSDDPEEYRNIVIEVSSLNHCQRAVTKGRGAPPKYDWESFWRAVAFHLYAAANDHDDIDMPVSLQDWARNAGTDYKYVWGDKTPPATTTLEDKLRPLFLAVEKASDEPLKQFVTKQNSTGDK